MRMVFLIVGLFFISFLDIYGQGCDGDVPIYIVDLSNPTTDSVSWVLDSDTASLRDGVCCTDVNCIEFHIILSDNADIFSFDFDGAPAQQYHINCTWTYNVKDRICLDNNLKALDTIKLAYCKNGNNTGSYTITVVQEVKASNDIAVSDGCAAEIAVEGLTESTIQWQTLPGGSYDSYLSCLSGCDTTTITPQPGYPPFIDVVVTGDQQSTCSGAFTTEDTVRVHFVSEKFASIAPADPAICFGGTSATLTATATGGAPPYQYRWSTGETTPSIDVNTAGDYWVEITDTTACPPIYDTVTVTKYDSQIDVYAGEDFGICDGDNIILRDSVASALGAYWYGGSGTFANNDSLAIDPVVTYTPAQTEIDTGGVQLILMTTRNGDCAPDYDTVVVAINKEPYVFAGNDTTVCAAATTLNLYGAVWGGSTTGVWSVISGSTGTFDSAADQLTNSYTVDPTDTTRGYVEFILTSTNNGNCIPGDDTIRITFQPEPIALAGSNTRVCTNNAIASLDGEIYNATGGYWSTSGSGSFGSANTDLANTYIPSADDITNGTVGLFLTTTGNGKCAADISFITVIIDPAPTVEAGNDTSVCTSVAGLQLSGSVTGLISTTGKWSSNGSGTFTPNDSALNATYLFDAADYLQDSIMIYLNSSNNQHCAPVVDSFSVKIIPAPTVLAGADQQVCANNSAINLNGSLTLATQGIWASTGGGAFGTDTDLITTYNPGTTAGFDTLFLTNTDYLQCPPVTDSLVVELTAVPVIEAGNDDTICANTGSFPVNATITGVYDQLQWNVLEGAGSADNPSSASTSYQIHTDDTLVRLELVVTDNANGCLPVRDTVSYTLLPSPLVYAGSDQTICANYPHAVIGDASLIYQESYQWQTSGTGSLSATGPPPDVSYTFSSADTAAGSVTLTLEATNQCAVITDDMVITFSPAPVVNAGMDTTLCSSIGEIDLSGSVNGGAATGKWNTSGDGIFNPDTSDLSATYVFGSTDISLMTTTLTLTSTNNGGCLPVSDSLVLEITALPVIEAGNDDTICANAGSFPVSATITGVYDDLQWNVLEGSGTVDNPSSASTSYQIHADDTLVRLELVVTDNVNGCMPVRDTVDYTMLPSPTVFAGSNQTICANYPFVVIDDANLIYHDSYQWQTGGTGTLAATGTPPDVSYTFSSADTAAGSVTLTLEATNHCAVTTDDLVISFSPAPIVYAGTDTTLCSSIAAIQLNGSVSGGAISGNWSTSGNGIFNPVSSDLGAAYTFGTTDTTLNTVTLTLTSTNNGGCLPVTDARTLTLIDQAVVNITAPDSICTTENISLSATITGGSGQGVWTTANGTGTFSPDNAALDVTYTTSAQDKTNGNVSFTFTTINNFGCPGAYENTNVIILPPPTVEAGTDKTICANNTSVLINDWDAGENNFAWSTSGSGTFNASADSSSFEYLPSSADTAAGSVYLTLTVTDGCAWIADSLRLTFTPAPYVFAGDDQYLCEGESLVALQGTISGVISTGFWSHNGEGVFQSPTTSLSNTYEMMNADLVNKQVALILTSDVAGGCLPAKDTMMVYITTVPTIEAGANQLICSNDSANVSATITGGSGKAQWTTAGDGTFYPSDTAAQPSYIPGPADITNGSVVLTATTIHSCQNVSDQLTVNISVAPVVDAGDNQLVCEGIVQILVNGNVSANGLPGTWLSSGTGTFDNNNNLSTQYNITADDFTQDSIYLVLQSSPSAGCATVTDTLTLRLLNDPIVDAGVVADFCDNDSALLNGTITGGAGTGTWTTSGDGFFYPSADSLNNLNYIPGPNDISNGTVQFALTTTNTGTCPASGDITSANILPGPVANAGIADTTCTNNAIINLSGSVVNAGGGTWSSLTGNGSFTSNIDLNTVYSLSANELDSSIVRIMLETTGNGICASDFDTVEFTVIPPAQVSAGEDKFICTGTKSVFLQGSISGVTQTGLWKTMGSGTFFPDAQTPSPMYQLSNADTTAKNVTLVLESTSNRQCNTVTDTMRVVVTPLPSVDAGADQTACANNPNIALSGTVTGGSGTGTWFVPGGDGSFTPDQNNLNATYNPGIVDITSDSIYIVLMASDACVSVRDTLTIILPPAPVVFAGEDILICENVTDVPLNGSVTGTATEGNWETLGDGGFNNASDLNATYTPGAADKAAGSVQLILHSANEQFNCLPETDTLQLSFGVRPTSTFTLPDTTCAFSLVNGVSTGTVSEGIITDWKWIINQDTLATQHMSYAFDAAGLHTVHHVVYSDKGCSDTASTQIFVPTVPVADFNISKRCETQEVAVSNISSSGVYWEWDFDNGETSNVYEPAGVVFDTSGTYRVQLVMTDVHACKDTMQKEVFIQHTPHAGFKADRFCEGTTAVFNDQATVTGDVIIDWFYDFGDGTFSNERNPSHTYVTSDSVLITQIVSTQTCSDTFTLKTAPVPVPTFGSLPAEGCSPLDVTFALDTLEDASYFWDYDDGFTSRLKVPSHTFLNNSDTTRIFHVKLVVQTASGCTDSVTNPVTVFANPTVNFSADAMEKCSNDTFIFTQNTINAIDLTWNFGDGTPAASGTEVSHAFVNNTQQNQFYPVKLTGETMHGCIDSTIKYVTVYPIPDISISFSADTACDMENVMLSTSPGGVSYEWDFGDGTYATAGNAVGHVYSLDASSVDTTYQISLIYTSANACKDTSGRTLVVKANPDVDFVLSASAGCAPYFTPEITNLTTGGFEFYWDFGTGEVQDTMVNDSQFSYNFSNTTARQVSKTISLTALSNNGCLSSADRTVSVYPAMTASFTASDTEGCDPLNINFESTSVDASSNRWLFGDGFTSTNRNPLHTFSNDTNFTVNYQTSLISSNAFGCVDTSEIIQVLVHPSPDAFFQIDNSAGCSEFTLSVSNYSRIVDSLRWNMGDGTVYTHMQDTFQHVYRNLTDNVIDYPFTLTAYNGFGCTDTVAEIINVYPEVYAYFDADTVGCTPYRVAFTHQSEGAEFYNWTFGDGNTSTSESPLHTYSNLTMQPRNYTARLKTVSRYGCEDVFERQFTVFNQPDATFTISDNDICAPDSIVLNDSTVGGELYHWDFGDGNTVTTTDFKNAVFYDNTSNAPLTHDIELIVENRYACTDTVSHTVTVYPQIQASFDAINAGCSPLPVSFNNTSDFVVTYHWQFGDGGVSGLPHPQHTYINESENDTTYHVILMARSHFGCTDTASGTVEVYASPDPEFDITPSYQEFPNATVTIDNTTHGSWNYVWDFEDGTVMQVAEPVSHTYADWGTYRVIMEAISITHPECKDTVSHVIQIVAGHPVADYDTAFAGCAPLTVTFRNKSVNADWYEWSFGDGGKSDNENPTYTYNYPGTFVVRLKAMNVHDYDISEKHTIVVHRNPIAYFQVAPQVVTIPDALHTYNLSDNAVRYKWNFGDGYESEDPIPSHYYEHEGKYTITLEAWSEHGCYDSIIKVDEAIVESGCQFLFPDAFTPNPDGSNDGHYDPTQPELTNDVFHPLYNNMRDYTLEIYNKWGELLFISNDIDVGWNGFYKGKLAPQGVYIWKARAFCINGKVYEKAGTVTLVR